MSEAAAVRGVELKNHPAPDSSDIRRVRAALREIGGVIPPGFGKFSGKNRIDLLWGQSETSFDAGRMRIRFFDREVLPVYTRRSFRVTNKALEIVNKYQQFRKRRIDAILNNFYLSGEMSAEDNANYHALLFMPTEYILRNHVPVAEWEKLNSSVERPEEVARLLPDGWFFLEDLPEVEEIGTPCFYAVQWCDPVAIDTRKNWEANRFGVQAVIDLNGTEHFVDILGEYPKYGDYHNVLLKIDDGQGGYALPSERNCLEPIRQMIDDAKRRTKQEEKVGHRVKTRARLAHERINLASAARSTKRREIMLEEGQVHIVGETARVFPKKRETYWGKPRKSKKKGKKIK